MKGLKKIGAFALVAAATVAVAACVQIALEKEKDEEGEERSFFDKCKSKLLEKFEKTEE